MQDQEKQATQSMVIGNKFPIDMSAAPFSTISFQLLNDEAAAAIWHINGPTKLELHDFNYGSIKVGVTRQSDVMFFCIDQQPFAESDSSFHRSFYNYPDDMHMMKSKTDIGLPVYLYVVDQNNILRAIRGINLNKAVTDYIADIFDGQRNSISPDTYRNIATAVYKKYPTPKDLMDACEAKFEINKKGLVQ